MSEQQGSEVTLDDLLASRSANELTQTQARKFEEAVRLVQAHLDELKALGYVGPEPISYDSSSGVGILPDRPENGGVVLLSFPMLIKGGLAGSTRNLGMRSIWLATMLWDEWPVERVAAIFAHELLHLSLGAFDESEVDERLSDIFGVDLST